MRSDCRFSSLFLQFLRNSVIFLFSCSIPPGHSNVSISILGLVAYGAENIIPSINLAAAECNEMYAPHITFNVTVFGKRHAGDFCDDFKGLVSAALAEFYYKNRSDNSYFFVLPTGCSAAISYTADLSREWNVPTISSGGSDSGLRDKSRFPTLVCIAPSKTDEFAAVFLELLRRYKWRRLNFICDSQSRTALEACSDFQNILFRQRNYYDVYSSSALLDTEERRVTALVNGQAHSRVTVILASMDIVRLTLVTAASMGRAGNNYAYITDILHFNTNNPIVGSPQWFRNDSFNAIAKAAFQAILIITMRELEQTSSLHQFFSTIDRMSAEDNFPEALETGTPCTDSKHAQCTDDSKLYAIYTYATIHSTAQVINESLANGGDLSNGIAFAHRMYNRSFRWLDQDRFNVNMNGDSAGIYGVLAYSSDTERMEEALLYDATKKSLYESPTGYAWIRNSTSSGLDESDCELSGHGDHCQASDIMLAVEVAVPMLLIVVSSIILMIWIHHRQRRDNWLESPWNLTPAYFAYPYWPSMKYWTLTDSRETTKSTSV